MRISELSRYTGVPVATVKYYIREGLLPPGRATSATQAQYGDAHVERLRLLRALLGTGGLSVSAARDIVAALDHPPTSIHDLLGTAHDRLGPDVPADVDTTSARALLRELGWPATPDGSALRQFAVALDALRDGGVEPTADLIRRYAEAARALGDQDVADVPTDSPEAVHFVVIATILLEPVLLALRRLAHIEASQRRFEDEPVPRSDVARGHPPVARVRQTAD